MRRLLLFLIVLLPMAGQSRSAIFLFGPAGSESAKNSARGASTAARRWMAKSGSGVELRRTGSNDGVTIDPAVAAKQVDQLFLDAARQAREAETAALPGAIEAAAQALVSRPAPRVLAVSLDSPPASTELDEAVRQVIHLCQANAIRVVVATASAEVNGALNDLARLTGGAVVRSAKTLDDAMVAVTAVPRDTAAATVEAAPAGAGQIAMRTRFLRTTSRGTQTYGVERSRWAANEGGSNTVGATVPMRGLFLVEVPMSGLKFETNEAARTYVARVRVTQIARDAKGAVGWQARKEVTIRGPLNKLDARRAGLLYYMRNVQLPGGRFTLEASVEDLTAGTRGTAAAQVPPGQGMPGLSASDAVFVRPFDGSVDRFEADSIFSYDANALSPLLAPAFPANQAFNLQVFFTIYPDIYGTSPAISLELLASGRVVGRAALPFTDKLRDTAREGVGSQMGEQKSQFPYLASLRGAKLPAGEYEARVTVSQDRNVVVRSVPFQVTGAGEVAREPVGSAQAPAAEEETEFVMPEVDPVAVRKSGPELANEELERIWRDAADSALGYTGRLPNFRCLRETRQLTASLKNPEALREGDVMVDELTYESNQESYQPLLINGLKANKQQIREKKGVRSTGEFGSMLKAIFGPEVGAAHKWAGYAMAGGAMCRVFDIEVTPKRSNFVLTHNTRMEVAGYTGRLFLDEESNQVRRLTIQGTALPKDFALQSPAFSLEYGLVRVGDQDHVLPLRSVLQMRRGKSLVRNETVFRGYKKFEASSQIKF